MEAHQWIGALLCISMLVIAAWGFAITILYSAICVRCGMKTVQVSALPNL